VNGSFIKKNIFVVVDIIISFETLSMIFGRCYQWLLTGTKSNGNSITIRLSTLGVVRYLLNRTWICLGTNNR